MWGRFKVSINLLPYPLYVSDKLPFTKYYILCSDLYDLKRKDDKSF